MASIHRHYASAVLPSQPSLLLKTEFLSRAGGRILKLFILLLLFILSAAVTITTLLTVVVVVVVNVVVNVVVVVVEYYCILINIIVGSPES